MRWIFIILLFPVSCFGQFVMTQGGGAGTVVEYDASNYYFSNTGDDANSGTHPDTAKQTWSAFLSLSLVAGDSVFFNKGDTWRDVDGSWDGNLPWIGTSSNPITLTSYGSGDRPRILGSVAPTSWTQDGGDNRWWTVEAPDTFPSTRVFFHELDDSVKWGELVTYRTAVDAVNEYYHSNDTTYVYSTSNPASAFTSVEVPQGVGYAILSLRSDEDSAEYYVFDGLEIAYGNKSGIENNYPGSSPSGRELSGLTIRNCLIHHLASKGGSSGYGVHVSGMRDVLFENNEVHNCGRRGFSYRMDNRDGADSAWNIIIQDNYFHDGWHTTGPDIHVDDGIGTNTYLDTVIIRRNIISDDINKSISGYVITSIYLEHENGVGKMGSVWIYNNLITNRCAAAIGSGGSDTLYIHNNSIYGTNVNVASTSYAIAVESVDSIRIHNNIIHNSNSGEGQLRIISVGDSAVVDNNLYYSEAGYTNAWSINSNNYSVWATWKSSQGQDANSPTPVDPLFVDAPTSLLVYNTSDAIDGGVAISGYSTDYNGDAVGSPPNIGAYETNGGAPPGEAADYYIDPDGNDGGVGSISDPWFTLNKVWTVVAAGDLVYCRGGTYEWYSQQILKDVNGTSSDTIKIFAYPGETPIFTSDGGYIPPSEINDAYPLIVMTADYTYWKGITITDYEQPSGQTKGYNAMYVRVGSDHNYFEQLTFHNNGSGMYIRGGDQNTVLNCDFYDNEDPYSSNDYDNADGIAIAHSDEGDTSWVEGCRFWGNSDDGIDFYNNAGFVFVENCWSFHNGYPQDTWLEGGNGIGFKLGSGGTGTAADTIRQLINCISFGNRGSGFGEEEITSSVAIYNSFAYKNATTSVGSSWGSGFEFWGSSIPHWIKNNISYDNNDDYDVGTTTNVEYNDWNLGGVTISDADWISMDTTLLEAARLSDGSLPNIAFGHLTEGSDAIDAGTDVGLSYHGSAPDLGAFEYNPVTDGLVSYFNMDETSGSTMEDNYSDNDGTIVGATVADANAILGTSYDFDGTNDTINLGTDSDFRFTTSFSISMWVDADATFSASLVDNYNAGNAEGYFVHITSGVVELWCEGASQESVYGATSLEGAGWTHVVVTYDGSALRVYIDGSSDATPVSYSGTITYSSSCVIGGGGLDSSIDHFDGQIDEIGFWDEALSASEVTELYNSGAGIRHPFE